MLDSIRGSRPLIMAALALASILVLGAGKAPDTGGLKVALIDTQKVLNGYNGTIASNKALQKTLDDYQSRIQIIKTNQLLSEADQKRLSDLTVKEGSPAGLTDAEKAEKKKLTEQSQGLMTEFTGLQTKNPNTLTAADQTRIQNLTKIGTESDSRLSFLAKEAQDELEKQRTENMTRVLKEVRDGIGKVAKKEGYNLVLSSEIAWYADNDISDNVLKQINSK